MEIDELEMLREQVQILANKVAQLSFENSRQQAVIAVLNKEQDKAE